MPMRQLGKDVIQVVRKKSRDKTGVESGSLEGISS